MQEVFTKEEEMKQSTSAHLVSITALLLAVSMAWYFYTWKLALMLWLVAISCRQSIVGDLIKACEDQIRRGFEEGQP